MANTTRQRKAYRNNRISESRQLYVYGNAVPNPTYEPRRRENRPVKHKRTSSQIKKNRRQAMQLNKGYVMFLAVAALCLMLSCVYYVQLRTELTSRTRHIAQMQQTLTSMDEENTTRYNAVIDSVNLETVRERAMTDLGMIYATQDQVVEYDNPTGDYVQQYEKIPEGGVIADSLEADD